MVGAIRDIAEQLPTTAVHGRDERDIRQMAPAKRRMIGDRDVPRTELELFSHAAHGSMSPEEALGGFDFLLAVVPPVAVPAVCAFGGAVASAHARWVATPSSRSAFLPDSARKVPGPA